MDMPQSASKRLPKSLLNERQERDFINGRLADLQVRESDPPRYLRPVPVQGTGLFQCGECCNVWTSHRSFVEVDLVNFCLLDTENRQGCRKCSAVPIERWPTPLFKKQWLQEILDKAVTKYNKRKANKTAAF